MENESRFKDLEEDEELAALRLAALATLKQPEVESPSSSASIPPVDNLPVIPVRNTASFISHNNTDQNSGAVPGHQYYWRNSAPGVRRGRGRGVFPKITQRSNLIVITPISDDKSAEEKSTAPSLVLPQHRYCQSTNEDSSSPKTFTKRGPTRFNRHESDSDSSDSDYDNSDNGSYSNETILQDEHSEAFDQMTPEENFSTERDPKSPRISDRRLSFHNIDSDLTGKSATESMDREDDHRKSHESGKQSYAKYNYQPQEYGYSCITRNSLISTNGKKHDIAPHYKSTDFGKNSQNSFDDRQETDNYDNGSVSHKRERKLSQEDLRLELKKRMQVLQPDRSQNQVGVSKKERSTSPKEKYNRGRHRHRSTDSSNSDDGHAKRKSFSPYSNHVHSSSSSPDNSRYRRNWSSERSRNNSLTRGNSSWKDYPRNSPDQNRRHSHSPAKSKHSTWSPSPEHSKRYGHSSEGNTKCRTPSYNSNQSRSSIHSRKRHSDQSHERTSIHSPSKSDKGKTSNEPRTKQHLSPSPDSRNTSKTSRSRDECYRKRPQSPSPVKQNRLKASRSPNEQHEKCHQSPDKRNMVKTRQSPNEHLKTQHLSPEKQNRVKASRSPSEHHLKRHQSHSPDIRNRLKTSRERGQHQSPSPDRRNQPKTSRSPNERLKKQKHGTKKHETSKSPIKSHKQQRKSHSPIEAPKKSSERSFKKDYNHTPEKGKKRHVYSLSPNKSRKASFHSNTIKEKSLSPERTSKDKRQKKRKRSWSQSPESFSNHSPKNRQMKREKSISEERVSKERNKRKRSWSRSPESISSRSSRKHSRHRRRFSRSSSSLSSSNSLDSSSHSSSPRIPTISSVVKPVVSIVARRKSDEFDKNKYADSHPASKKGRDLGEKSKPFVSSVKSSIIGGENLTSVSDSGKRLPVHMRLGTLPRNRVIQMTKDVEAAFVNTSSDDDENANAKCKKQNFRVVTEMTSAKGSDVTKRLVEKSSFKTDEVSDEKTRRRKTFR